jgi:hypothetical protein
MQRYIEIYGRDVHTTNVTDCQKYIVTFDIKSSFLQNCRIGKKIVINVC